MRDYGKVYSTFWSSATTSGMSDDAKLLALYLMTCSHSTIAGVFRLPHGYVTEDLGWEIERIELAFSQLLSIGFVMRCPATKWVWVVKHLEWNPLENPNQRLAAQKVAGSIPSACRWLEDFMTCCRPLLGYKSEPSGNGSERVDHGSLNQKQKQKAGTEAGEEDKSSGRNGYPPEFEQAWAAYPARPGASKQTAFKAWSARLAAGSSAAAMLEGTKRYAQYCLIAKTEPQFIKQPTTFFGPGMHFEADWTPPRLRSVHDLTGMAYGRRPGEGDIPS